MGILKYRSNNCDDLNSGGKRGYGFAARTFSRTKKGSKFVARRHRKNLRICNPRNWIFGMVVLPHTTFSITQTFVLMTMNQLDYIASLNNKGCHDLTKGKNDNAMRCFKSALSFLKILLLDANHVDGGVEETPCLLPLHTKYLQRNISPVSGWAAVESHYFVFAHAIPLITGHRFSRCTRESSKVYISIVVFNLALTLHLNSLKSGCWRSLQKAQSLYLKSHDLIKPIINEYYQNGRATKNAAFDILVMALFNNLALVHLDLLDVGRAGVYFQILTTYASLVSAKREKKTYRLTPRDANERRGRQSWTEEVAPHDRMINYSDDFFAEKVDSMLLNASFVKLTMMSSPPVAPAA